MKVAIVAAALVVAAHARSSKEMNPWHSLLHLPADDVTTAGDTIGNSTFTQLIDHDNPDLGTFEQFYFYNTKYWAGPGSPVVLFTPGEVNVTGYTSYLDINRTTGVVAERIGAAVIALEHRYWGTSTPFTEFTTANLTYLTLKNSINDLTAFASSVELPFDTTSTSNADSVPWVLMGGSYSGALSAWTESVSPGIFWAYHASSAPTEAISDYWGYFLPVQQGMPKNCSADVNLVIDYMDNILVNGTADQVTELKAMFNMASIEYNDDFMGALENAPWLWQGNQFYTNTGFFEWCDYVENAVNVTDASELPGAEGVGVQKALQGYATWTSEIFLPGFCAGYGYYTDENSTECFNTHNFSSPMYRDDTPSNTYDRQWIWMTCNEPFGYWQDGAPLDRPTLVSRLIDPEWSIRQCGIWFPPGPNNETYGIAKGKTEDDVNAYTGGWNITNSTRLIYANGGFDPWREAGVSSDLRPGGPLDSTAQVPVNVVPGGFHTSDLVTENGRVNAGAQAVINAEVDQLAAWVAQWPKKVKFS